MVLIVKQCEPASLHLHRNTFGADFDGLDKTELRSSLLAEQGYLCAYCMKRIRYANKVKIEHYEARNKENELQYSNLLAVCDGNEVMRNGYGKVNPKRFTCDTMKGEQKLHINPQSEMDISTVYYDNQGKIYSTNKVFQEDFDVRLNLNDVYGYLVNNRKAALEPLMNKIKSLKPGQNALPLLKKLEKYCFTKNSEGEYPEYAGILQWYVMRQIRKHS